MDCRRAEAVAEAAPEPTDYDLSKVDYNTMNWASILGGSSTAPPSSPAATPAAAPAGGNKAAAPAAPAATPAGTPAAGSSSGSSGSSSGGGLSTGFGGKTTAQSGSQADEYLGNIGVPAGSNIIEVAAANANNYKHTLTFKSTASSPRKIVFWNKGGNGQGGANVGSFQTSSPAHTFTLQPGGSNVIAIDDDSQGGWCDWTDGKTTGSGQFNCAWGEFDFSDSANGGWSGFDVSKIVQNSAGGGPCNIKIENADGQYSSCDHNEYEAADGGAQDAWLGVKINTPETRVTVTHGDA